MNTISLSPNVLEWAAEKIGESVRSLAPNIAKREKDQAAILHGRLTLTQAEKFAKLTGTPYGFLFLDTPPPTRQSTIPDLRQMPDELPLGKDFFEVLDDALRKQDWYRDYLIGQGAEPLTFIGSFNENSDVQKVANDMQRLLRLSPAERRLQKTPEEYFSYLSARAEDIGILVLKSGIVRAQTKRALSIKEFRGFAIADPIAPLVFVNGKDWQVAWVFTLAHELVHIWLGKSGVCDLSTPHANKQIEIFCNKVAAEILLPKQEFIATFSSNGDLSELARFFRVSKLVVARRALDLDLIKLDVYNSIAEASARAKPVSDKTGGDPFRSAPVRNSKRFTNALLRSVENQRTLYKEAAQLLNASPNFVAKLATHLTKDA